VGLLRRPATWRVPDTVELAALLARISTEDQFQFGIRTFLAGLNAQSKLKAAPPPGPPPPLLACADTPVVEQLQQAANLRRLNVRRPHARVGLSQPRRP
jgi:hypothetical protein